jgi:hypothetical protein
LAPQSPELQLVGVEDRPLHRRDPLEVSLVLLPDLLPDRLKVVEDLGLGIQDELPVTAVDSLETGSQSAEDAGPGGGVNVLRRTTRYGPSFALFLSLPVNSCGATEGKPDLAFALFLSLPINSCGATEGRPSPFDSATFRSPRSG